MTMLFLGLEAYGSAHRFSRIDLTESCVNRAEGKMLRFTVSICVISKKMTDVAMSFDKKCARFFRIPNTNLGKLLLN